MGLNPPKPTASPKPGDELGASESAMEKEEVGKKPESRPGYNPFAARQDGEYAVLRRPVPQPGNNPFALREPTRVVIDGKVLPNPFL